MSADRFGNHWLSNTAAPGGTGGTSSSGRPQLNQQQPPLSTSSPSAAFPHNSLAAVTSSSAAGYGTAPPRHVDVNAIENHLGGYRATSTNTNTTAAAAPYVPPHTGNYYRPPRQQQQQQQQQLPQWPPHAVSGTGLSSSSSLVPPAATTNPHFSQGRSAPDSAPAYTVKVPPMSDAPHGATLQHMNSTGGNHAAHSHRGGGSGGTVVDHQRRRSDGGRGGGGNSAGNSHSDLFQGSRRQQQQPQQQQQQLHPPHYTSASSQRSQHGRPRGGMSNNNTSNFYSSGGGGVASQSSDASLHSRIASTSSGADVPSSALAGSSGETESHHHSADGSTNASPPAVTMVSAAINVGAASPPLPHPNGGSSTRRGSVPSNNGAGVGVTSTAAAAAAGAGVNHGGGNGGGAGGHSLAGLPAAATASAGVNNRFVNNSSSSGGVGMPHGAYTASAKPTTAADAATAAAAASTFAGSGVSLSGSGGPGPLGLESRADRHPLVPPAHAAAAAASAAPLTTVTGIAASTQSPRPSTSSHQRPEPPPPQHPHVNSAAVSRSGVSTSSSGAAVVAAVPRYTRPRGEDRPTVALSQNIMSVYQTINDIFYQERQRLFAAPAKYANGHYVPSEGEVIANRYIFVKEIGQGSFGKVLLCVDHKYDELVAVKIIRSGPYFESQGWFEAQVVDHLNNEPALQNLVVQLRKVFLWKGHMALVFEHLSISLYELIKLTKYNGVSLGLTRKFAYQMVKALLVLEQHQPPIIHCDLKPENVLLRDPERSGLRVIDFGSACYQQQPSWRLPPLQVTLPASSPSPSAGPPWDEVGEDRRASGVPGATAAVPGANNKNNNSNSSSTKQNENNSNVASSAEATTGVPPHQQQHASGAPKEAATAADSDVEVVMPKYIQSRYYRSPEVILELGYTTAIDRWSLGCFLIEMHTGQPLFPGNNEADMIAYFTMVLGPLPDYMIAASPKRTRLYHTATAAAAAEGGGREGRESEAAVPTTLGGASATTAASAAAQALLLQQQQQQQRRAASPLFAFTTAPSPVLTPCMQAPGHASGSPFFLRAPQVENAESATAVAVNAAPGSAGDDTPLKRILGVHSGGPRGCRLHQLGHDEESYELFYNFIEKLLQYDPRKRMSCAEAIQHPFLEPIRLLEAQAAAEAAAKAAAAVAAAAAPMSTPTPAESNGGEVGGSPSATAATGTVPAAAPSDAPSE